MLKTLKGILQITLLLAILLPSTVYFMLGIPAIQTYIVKKVTDEISQVTKTKVSIKSVNYKFFKSLVLEDLYVEDTQGDTILSVGKVEVSLESIWFSQQKINLSSTKLIDGQFNLITTSDTLNLDRLLARLSSGDIDTVVNEKKDGGYSISTNKLELENFRFSMQNRDETDVGVPTQINFEDLRVDSINLVANNIRFVSDSLFFDISKLNFREKSGFRIIKIKTGRNAYVCSKRAYLPELSIIDEYTNLQFNYFAMNYPNGLGDYLNKVRMEADISSGYLAFKTIGFFANSLLHSNIIVLPRGKIDGVVSSIHTENFMVTSANGFTNLAGNISIAGLPNIDNTIFKCNNARLTTSVNDANSLFKQITGSSQPVLGEEFEPLKHIGFSGDLVGFYNNFSVKGSINTNLGKIETDTKFNFSSPLNDFEIIGNLILNDFELGKIVGVEGIKNISLNVEMRGVQPKDRTFNMYGEGDISELNFDNYNFKNIDVAGTLDKNAFDGKFTCNDPKLNLNFIGRIDMNKTDILDYRFNFTANVIYADLYKLNLKTDDTTSTISGKIVADLRGKNINFNGNIQLQDVKYFDSKNSVDVGNIQLIATQAENSHRMFLQSTYLDAMYRGNSNIESFISTAQSLASKYMPNIFESNNINQNAVYELNVTTRKLQEILQIIDPNLFVAENSVANIKINGANADIKITSDFANFGESMFRNVTFNGSTDSEFIFNANCSEFTIKGFEFKNLEIKGNISDNNIFSNIIYDNKTQVVNAGNINLQTKILKNNIDEIYYKFVLNPSQITVNNTAWNFATKNVEIKSDYFSIDNFEAKSGIQRIAIDGAYSTTTENSIKLDLTSFDIANFNPIFETEGYKFSGDISGKAQLSNVLGNSVFFANIETTELSANDLVLGKMQVQSNWNESSKSIEFKSKLTKDKIERLSVIGAYTPSKDFYDLQFGVNNLDVKIIEPIISGELNNVEGAISGKINLKGVGGELDLLGVATLDNVGFTVDFLKTHYIVSDTVKFNKNQIQIKDATLFDTQKNKGKLNATVTHKNLKDFVLDINVAADKLLGLNTTQKDNDEFYGTAYITGNIRMNGSLEDLNFNINVHPERGTRIVIPTSSSSLSENTLLTFETKNDEKKLSETDKFLARLAKKKEESQTQSDLNIALNITMNNNAEVYLVLDQQSDDAITAVGSGNLQMRINPREEKFQLYGNYIINSGSYKWSLPFLNFVTKEFTISNGSQINFNGDLADTKLNITTEYAQQMRLTLQNLLSDTTVNKVRYPVIAKIQLTDNIANFNMKPSIEIQNIDVDTKARADAMLNTDDKVWKQLVALLITHNFMPDEQINSINGGASITSNLSEIISGQLSSWLATLKLPVDLGVNVRTGDTSGDTEFDARASVKLFDDRVEISGNIGSAPRTSTSDVAGDFDIDIKLTERLKLKAFSHSVDEYGDEAQTSRQGIRISYQGGFNTWTELWNSIFRPKRTRERREQYRNRQNQNQNQTVVDTTNNVQKNTNEFEINLNSADTIPKDNNK